MHLPLPPYERFTEKSWNLKKGNTCHPHGQNCRKTSPIVKNKNKIGKYNLPGQAPANKYRDKVN